jgi:acetyl-CoA C-acetyltransferase
MSTPNPAAGGVWLAAGVRTPFAKVDGPLAQRDVLTLSAPVLRAMGERAKGPIDFAVWGTVLPNLHYSNLAREAWLEAKLDPRVPAFSTVMACSTSMVAAFEAASMLRPGARDLAIVGGVESMSRVQLGLGQELSDRLRGLAQARGLGKKVKALARLRPKQLRLHMPRAVNRVTGKSMGEHCEEMAKTWSISRAEQDALALESHQRAVAAQDRGFFDDLLVPMDGLSRDTIPRRDTSLEKLARLELAFDRESGRGTLTAGNSTPFTDGAAALWVATDAGLGRLPANLPRVRLVDFEIAAVDLYREGLLMAPTYAIPRLLARHGLGFADVRLWEIHEAFSAQVACTLKALEDRAYVRDTVGVAADLGAFPRDRMNPNGGSVAIGHPFGATGARILSQAVKELADMPEGSRAIVSICADGGLGTVALLERPRG